MNATSGIIVGGIAVLMLGGLYLSMGKGDTQMEKKMDDAAMMQKESDAMMKDDMAKGDDMMQKDAMEDADMMKKDEAAMDKDMMQKDEVAMDKDMMDKEVMMKGSYEAFAPEKLALAESGDVVLFFHASWCPSCRSLNADIEAHRADIPEGVSILKVDYDAATELKKKYGVTTQHTLVQVDANGTLIKKWSGSPSLARVLTEIQ